MLLYLMCSSEIGHILQVKLQYQQSEYIIKTINLVPAGNRVSIVYNAQMNYHKLCSCQV